MASTGAPNLLGGPKDQTYTFDSFEGFKHRKGFLQSYDKLMAQKVQLESKLATDPDNASLIGQLAKVEEMLGKTSYFHNVRASSNVEAAIAKLEKRLHRIEARIETGTEKNTDGRNAGELRAKIEQLRKQDAEYPTVSKVAAKGVNFAYRMIWGTGPSDSDSDS